MCCLCCCIDFGYDLWKTQFLCILNYTQPATQPHFTHNSSMCAPWAIPHFFERAYFGGGCSHLIINSFIMFWSLLLIVGRTHRCFFYHRLVAQCHFLHPHPLKYYHVSFFHHHFQHFYCSYWFHRFHFIVLFNSIR